MATFQLEEMLNVIKNTGQEIKFLKLLPQIIANLALKLIVNVVYINLLLYYSYHMMHRFIIISDLRQKAA